MAKLNQILPEPVEIKDEIANQVKRDALYANYISRQARDIAAMERDENLKIPRDMQYVGIPGLSNELGAKLTRVQPESLAQAGRIDGMTPAAIMLLLSWLKKTNKEQAATGT